MSCKLFETQAIYVLQQYNDVYQWLAGDAAAMY